MRSLFTFPDPVNEVAARTVACGVVALCVGALALRSPVVLCGICAGFYARVCTGPTLSPLGQVAVRVVAPHFAPRPVPGPPKRFAQGMGAAITSLAVVAWLALGWDAAAITLCLVLVAACLEGFAGYCIGCTVFGWLMRVGVIPERVCVACADLSARTRATTR